MTVNMSMRFEDGCLIRDELNGKKVNLNIHSGRPRGV